MPVPENRLKTALLNGETQIGLWMNLVSPIASEIVAGAGFDWCLVDAEHGPNTVATILPQLQAVATKGTTPIVRVPVGEDWVLKQVLDIGVQTVMVPMVETPDQAAQIAAAVRYPPLGKRGMGAALARASDYSGITDYVSTANDQICLIAQVESVQAVENIDAIAAVDGVDCVFIGPADLAADMGYPGQSEVPEVQAMIDHAIARIAAAGKPSGMLTFDPKEAETYRAKGVGFIAVGSDVNLLVNGAAALRAQFG